MRVCLMFYLTFLVPVVMLLKLMISSNQLKEFGGFCVMGLQNDENPPCLTIFKWWASCSSAVSTVNRERGPVNGPKPIFFLVPFFC